MANRALILLCYAWAAPASAVGLVLAALSLGRMRAERGALWVDATRGVGALVRRRRGPSATTFGHVVLVWRPERWSASLREHELVHVHQYDRLGVLFFVAYLALRPFYGSGARHPLEKPAYARGREVSDETATRPPY